MSLFLYPNVERQRRKWYPGGISKPNILIKIKDRIRIIKKGKVVVELKDGQRQIE